MAKRRRPGKNQPTDIEAIDPMMSARLPSEPSPSGPKAGFIVTTDALESAAASLARAAGKPETFFRANEGVAKVRSSILLHTSYYVVKPCYCYEMVCIPWESAFNVYMFAAVHRTTLAIIPTIMRNHWSMYYYGGPIVNRTKYCY